MEQAEQAETVEEPNNIDIESVTKEHPKTTTKLSKSIKQSQTITQQSKTIKKYIIKEYRESKAIDYHLKLEILRRHNNLPQNCSQFYEIKILGFKEVDGQLELKRSCIKNKLFEITKEFKDFKIQQNLKVEFKNNEKGLEETIFFRSMDGFIQRSV